VPAARADQTIPVGKLSTRGPAFEKALRFKPPLRPHIPVAPGVVLAPGVVQGILHPSESVLEKAIGPPEHPLPVEPTVLEPDESRPRRGLDVSLVHTTDFSEPSRIQRSVDFQISLVYRNWHLASHLFLARPLDILNEPNVSVQFSFDPPEGIDPFLLNSLRSTTFQASVSALNFHAFQLHGQDLLELSLDAGIGAQMGREGTAAVGQIGPTAQLHVPGVPGGPEALLTLSVTGQAKLPGDRPDSAGPQQDISLSFGQVSAGVSVQW
jgi:hypothetical protein